MDYPVPVKHQKTPLCYLIIFLISLLIFSGQGDLVDDGVQLEVGVLPDAPGLVLGGAASCHGPRRREGQQAARVRPRPGRLDEGQDSGGGQQKKDCLMDDEERRGKCPRQPAAQF